MLRKLRSRRYLHFVNRIIFIQACADDDCNPFCQYYVTKIKMFLFVYSTDLSSSGCSFCLLLVWPRSDVLANNETMLSQISRKIRVIVSWRVLLVPTVNGISTDHADSGCGLVTALLAQGPYPEDRNYATQSSLSFQLTFNSYNQVISCFQHP